MRFEIVGLEVVPYVRMTRRGKWVKAEAQRYLDAQEAIRGAFDSYMLLEKVFHGQGMFVRQPLAVKIELDAPPGHLHKCDLDNQAKAILDAMNKVVFEDDRWVDRIEILRRLGDDWLIIVEVEEIR